ncbi:MAG TPA: IS1182 family transposase [Ktedonobacterales bacterium]|nr:IS1182 family transposase [Ktedonobacterales bacterium]
MLGIRDPQATIADGDQLYLSHVGEKTFYGYLARHRHELFRDEQFADLYKKGWGRPSVPPSTLCVALVLQHYDGCSDQEAADSAAYDQRWKVALGAADTERPFAKSTLQLFRAQLVVHEKARQIFQSSLNAARQVGRLKSEGNMRAALDTTNILGRGAVRDTYNLIGDGILSVMRALAKQRRQPLEKWAHDKGLKRYLGSSVKGEAAIDWDDAQARSNLLAELVTDAERVLRLAQRSRASCHPDSPEEERLIKASQILGQVLLQDIEREGDQVRIRRGTSADRICSVHDPEMRHGRKSASTRFDGHKLAVAADVESQLLVAVDIMAGSAKDDEGSLELAQQAEATTGLKLEAALGDCAYGSGDNRERFAEADIALMARVPARPENEYFSKDAFEIDTERMTCRCPAGQVTSNLYRSGAVIRGGSVRQRFGFRFTDRTCAACPLRTKCYKPGKTGRTVQLHPHEATMQAARQWQHSSDFDLFRRQRQVVEHRLARLIQLGVRQARYFGRHKTLFQALMVATVANLTLIAGLDPIGRTPRTSHSFIDLAWSVRGRVLALGHAIYGHAIALCAWRSRPEPAHPLQPRVAGSRPGL